MGKRSKWLFDENPLMVDRVLATAIGLEKAIVIQQVNYWINRPKAHFQNGHYWVWNSIKKWRETNFPFWSESTVKRWFKRCEEDGLIISGVFNKATFDRTKWYTINYEKLNKCVDDALAQSDPDALGQSEPITLGQSEPITLGQSEPTYTRDYLRLAAETTTREERYKKDYRAEPDGVSSSAKEIIDYLNAKTGTKYRSTTGSTRRLIKARLNEGFTVDDFRTVIDKKTAAWLHDQKMSKYLRPQTLFGTKFESYLNEQDSATQHVQTREERDREITDSIKDWINR